jgi:hypothetical protein
MSGDATENESAMDPAAGPIRVEPPPGGFDRAGIRELLAKGPLPRTIHRIVRAPFGHTALTLEALEAIVETGDLALQAGETLHGVLLEDIARSGSFAIPEPTRDQRMFIGAFCLTVLADALVQRLAELAPTPTVESDLEAAGLEDLLEEAPREVIERVLGMLGRYVEVQAKAQPGANATTLDEREVWVISTLHAFVLQLRGTLERLTHLGRLRPFGVALARRKVSVGNMRYEGFVARPKADAVTDLKPVSVDHIVGNEELLETGMRLAQDVAAFDLQRGESPKKLNPVLFALGRPGCGKTVTAHAIGNYFLEYCRGHDVPARFRVIRRTDWASSYQNASAASLVRIFKDEVYGFDGVCGVYWPDIDTAFASRQSGELRMEEKNNLGAVFGIFDGTLIPKDGKWFMICDANFMQMDEATVSRIAQNPLRVKGPQTVADYVRLMRDIMLGDVKRFVVADEDEWQKIGQACVDDDLSGRAVESVAGNIRTMIQDFEYTEGYFKASYDERARMVDELSKRVPASTVAERIREYVLFHKEAEEAAAKQKFEEDVEQMVRQLNAGREAAARAALGVPDGPEGSAG